MCTELFLAFIYFSVLFVMNLFLEKLLLDYGKQIIFFRKRKMFFSYLKESTFNLFSFLCFAPEGSEIFKKWKEKRTTFFHQKKRLSKLFSEGKRNDQDLLLLGNRYKYLRNSFENSQTREKEITKGEKENYFFYLLKLQYLSERKN